MATATRVALSLGLVFRLFTDLAQARPPIRSDFFEVYPGLLDTQLDDLPSDSKHCGVCHFDFGGGGARNPYGLGIEIGINNGLSNHEAVMAIENDDSDNDGFDNIVELLSTLYTNTPTFPGLSPLNVGAISSIPQLEVDPYLVPAGSTDTTPPVVDLIWPDGGESISANQVVTVNYTATDASGISHVNFYLSDDSGASYEPVALQQAGTGSFDWFVPNLPSVLSRLRVEAVDNAGNAADDISVGDFTILGITTGIVPSTLRDVKLPGTQPNTGVVLEDADATCATCHGNYNTAIEPWANWRGSMMGQAARDPLFFAAVAVAEQDAPSVGDVCIRCHTPGGWMEGRSVDTGGGLLTAKDRQGVQCDFCHKTVDLNYVEGVSPPQDAGVLAALTDSPTDYANGGFIVDPEPLRRGPRADAQAAHAFVESPFHRSSDICGTCHDVSNPVFIQLSPGVYAPNTFDEEHPTMTVRNMGPIERTFSEWTQSEYASTGVYAPEFAGTKPDGIVSTCQDCHMADVAGKGADTGPNRSDLAMHDFTGGNTFIPEILATFYPSEVDVAQLMAARNRARAMLQKAATLELTPQTWGVSVRVINETGHKLPSGYPEGRRIWLNVRAFDDQSNLVYSSTDYDAATGELHHDESSKIYEVHPGLSDGLGTALGLPPGPSFHFVLNDSVFYDNRIPPRGFTNAAFETIQSPPVAYGYADGEYWDDTDYTLPVTAASVEVTLYYQTTSKEFVEFLRDENVTNTLGQELYDAWVAQGRNAPETMAQATTAVNIDPTAVAEGEDRPTVVGMSANHPNPFQGQTSFSYWLPEPAPVRISVYDLRGRHVRTLVDETFEPGRYEAAWDGRDARGRAMASGVFMVRLEVGRRILSRRVMLLR